MRVEYVIKDISKYTASEFIQKFHYSPVMPSLTKHFLGFYVDNKLKGVLTLGWGTQPRQTINKMFPGLESKDYFEIGKMCMDDDMPRNSESQMISATVKWMKKNTKCLFLYTMADGIMGKCGYVYQASNFYFGEKYWTQVYLMENGEKLLVGGNVNKLMLLYKHGAISKDNLISLINKENILTNILERLYERVFFICRNKDMTNEIYFKK